MQKISPEWKISVVVAVSCHVIGLYAFHAILPGSTPTGRDAAPECTLEVSPSEFPPFLTKESPALACVAPEPERFVKPPEPLPAVEEVEPVAPPAFAVIPDLESAPVQPPVPELLASREDAVCSDSENTELRDVGSSKSPSTNEPISSSFAGSVSTGEIAMPRYHWNPKPAYPAAARRRGQQGLVLLAVNVTAEGRAARVELKQSSSHPLLDRAALKAVRDWEFKPARIGSVATESEIEVPVRFLLTE